VTSEPLPPECAEVQRRLAEGEAGPELLGHLAGCAGCSAFAAALVELEARMARLPEAEPPAGAIDRAIARFRTEVAALGAPGTAPLATPPVSAPPVAPLPRAAGRPLTRPPSPSAGTGPPSKAPSARPHRGGHARQRRTDERPRRHRWHPRVTLAAGAAAVIALVVALVAVLGPGSAPPAYAAILHQAAASTAAEKSYRFDLAGSIGFTVGGKHLTALVSGTGASEGPDKGELSQQATLAGKPLLQQDVVTVGQDAWTRSGSGQWVQVPISPDHASAVDQALDNPSEALNALARVGFGYRGLGTTTVSGTPVRRIGLTIPPNAFNPFGNLSERAGNWRVQVYVSQQGLVLRRLGIKGSGVVDLLGTQVPFSYVLQLTLSHFGVKVSIRPPAGVLPAAPSATATPASASSRPTSTPSASPGPSAATSAGPTPTPSGTKTSFSHSVSPTPTCAGTSAAATPATTAAARPACVQSQPLP
jgi:hypothetical protein